MIHFKMGTFQIYNNKLWFLNGNCLQTFSSTSSLSFGYTCPLLYKSHKSVSTNLSLHPISTDEHQVGLYFKKHLLLSSKIRLAHLAFYIPVTCPFHLRFNGAIVHCHLAFQLVYGFHCLLPCLLNIIPV